MQPDQPSDPYSISWDEIGFKIKNAPLPPTSHTHGLIIGDTNVSPPPTGSYSFTNFKIVTSVSSVSWEPVAGYTPPMPITWTPAQWGPPPGGFEFDAPELVDPFLSEKVKPKQLTFEEMESAP